MVIPESQITTSPLSTSPTTTTSLPLPVRASGVFGRSRAGTMQDQGPPSPALSTFSTQYSPEGSLSSSLSSLPPNPRSQNSLPRPDYRFPSHDTLLHPRLLPDGLMESVEGCIHQVKDAKCMACDLMPNKRNASNAKFPKRHVQEVHTNPLAVEYAQGRLTPKMDALYIAIAAVRMKSPRAKPRTPPAVITEVNEVMKVMENKLETRPETLAIPAIRAWIHHFTEANMGWWCDRCGQRYTRKASYDRHNCATDSALSGDGSSRSRGRAQPSQEEYSDDESD